MVRQSGLCGLLLGLGFCVVGVGLGDENDEEEENALV